MKIAFFGTPEFAWNILSWILSLNPSTLSQVRDSRAGTRSLTCPGEGGSFIDVKLVVSQPDKLVGRKRELKPTPVKQIALNADIEVLQPVSLRNPPLSDYNSVPLNKGEPWTQWNRGIVEVLKNLNLDFIVVVAYGKIIPQAILDIPKHWCINIHGSILPDYRWASPVQAAVKDGLTETWLTTMYMSKGMDEWDMLKIGKVVIDKDDTSEDVFQNFVEIWPELLVSTLKEIMSWDLKWIPQDHSKATYCGKISREDGEVSFTQQSSSEIYNTYRAYIPWPGIYTWYEGKRLVLEEVSLYNPPLSDNSSVPLNKGEHWTQWNGGIDPETQNWERCLWEFIKLSKNTYGILCADKKILEIHRVKLEGKKSMDIQSFVNGNKEIVWYKFM